MGKLLNVLIIEDSEDDVLLLIRHLKQYGYDPVFERVETAAAMLEALEKQPWDIVISDYILPQFTGMEALKIIENTRLDIPCIIVSGRITDEIAVAAMKAGASDYVMKDNLKRMGAVIERELADVEVRQERRRAEEQTRTLSRRLLMVQEEERRNIARELHDELGQSLTGLKLMLNQAARSVAGNNEALNEAQATVTELIQQVREMALTLRPSMLDDIGLLPTLIWHIERYTAQTQVKVKFEHQGYLNKLGANVDIGVFRIIQEALTNVAKYAGVKEVSVSVQAKDDHLLLKIEDCGCGFDLSRISMNKPSTGLSGMKERAQLLGGNFIIETQPGAGTRLIVEIPIQHNQ